MKRAWAGALLAAWLGAAAPVRAEVELREVSWQTARWQGGRSTKPKAVESLSFEFAKLRTTRVLAKLTLLNRGPAMRGVLLRYAMTARIAPAAAEGEGSWALPFMIEEKRVPDLKANQRTAVTLDPSALLTLYLRRLERAGWRARELRLEVMVDPRKGDTSPLQTLSNLLKVEP